jgi:uncharacterized membrane protein
MQSLHSIGAGRRGITVLTLVILIVLVVIAAVFIVRYLQNAPAS